jgi:two-component system nitrate/nitrite response regulator NarL
MLMTLEAIEGPAGQAAMTGQVTVLVAAAQPLWREAVARVIHQDPALRLVAEAPDGSAALAAIVRQRPSVAVLDERLPGLDSGRILRAVRDAGAGTRVIVMAEDLRPGLPYRAVADGASGYLTKDATGEQLRRAIVRVAAGQTVLAPPVQGAIAGEIRSRERGDRPLLSRREREVLGGVARGLSTPEIAASLVIGQATVKTHLAHLYGKLEVSDRASAVAAAMRRGLLD